MTDEINPDLGFIIDASASMPDPARKAARDFEQSLDALVPEGTVIELTDGEVQS
jgi:hypothetical protein